MNGNRSKLHISCCDIRSQLLATASVRPRQSSSIALWPPLSSSSSCSLQQPVAVVSTKRVAAAAAERGSSTSRFSFSALTQELELSASQVAGRSGGSGQSSATGDRVVLGKVSPAGVFGVFSSFSSSSCQGNYCHYHYKTRIGLLGSRDRSRVPSVVVVVPGGFQRRRTRVCRWGLPALSYRVGVCEVEGRTCCKKGVSLRGRSGLSGKRESGNLERMELFKPQLIDTLPFRFLSEYHTAPPRAVRDAISPIFFFGFGQSKPVVEVVQAGDPVLHEPAAEVRPEEIGTARVEKIINDMVATMRNAPGVGLAAPQIGVDLQIIVLEDTKELMSYCSPEECDAQQRFPFDLLVIINPKLKAKSGSGSAVFFEGCLSVEGYRALVERDLEVEVTGLGRDGRPIRVEASGWKARILQHECDHLAGTLYVDKMLPRTFRTKDNLRLPLPAGCPQQGVCKHSTKSLKL